MNNEENFLMLQERPNVEHTLDTLSTYTERMNMII